MDPVFDQVPAPTSSIGAIQVSLSNPDIVYVGTGDMSMVGGSVNIGDGVYKSTDVGNPWRHIGLDEAEHIGYMWVDPKNPDIVVVAALGRTYSKSEQRGVFKTTDDGRTWKKVLYTDDVTGAVDLAFASGDSKIGYVALMEHYTRPGARAAIESTGAAGIFKTTDGGDTWTQLKEGLPGGRSAASVLPQIPMDRRCSRSWRVEAVGLELDAVRRVRLVCIDPLMEAHTGARARPIRG